MKQEDVKDTDKVTTEVVVTSNTIFLWFVTIGMLLIAAGTVMPLLMQEGDLFKYVYGGGAVILLIGRIFTTYKGTNLRLKRLYRIEAWASIFFCVATFFMFYESVAIEIGWHLLSPEEQYRFIPQ